MRWRTLVEGNMNVEFDLKKILTEFKQGFDKIDARFDKLERKVDKVGEDVSDLKTNLARVEAELKGEIKVLEEKVDGMTKRVDAQEFINRGVIVGLLLAVLGGLTKIFGLVSK